MRNRARGIRGGCHAVGGGEREECLTRRRRRAAGESEAGSLFSASVFQGEWTMVAPGKLPRSPRYLIQYVSSSSYLALRLCTLLLLVLLQLLITA
jgi:hypothetical protein